MSELAWTGLFSLILSGGVGIGEGLRRVGLVSDTTRRIVHLYTGMVVAVGVYLMPGPAPFYLLAAAFVVVNGVALSRGLFPSMHSVGRPSLGTVVFPLGLLVALWGCWTVDPSRKFAVVIAFVVLSFSDPLAAWVGTRWGAASRIGGGLGSKSGAGSGAFFLSATALTAGGLWALDPFPAAGPAQLLVVAMLVGLVTTGAELVGNRGWDNLFIVVAVTSVLVAVAGDPAAPGSLVWAVLLALGFGALSFRLRFLETSGTVAAGLLAFWVAGLGGAHWAVPGFTFFFLASVLSKVGKARKRKAVQAEKGSRRDVSQVFANGGVGWALLALSVYQPHPALYWGFVGAFAAAAADTWATEVGTLVRGPTRSIVTFRPVPAGQSGGISVAGTLGAIAGAASVAVAAVVVPPPGGLPSAPVAMGLIILAGVVGSLLDSLLGATVQAQFVGPDGQLTERRAGVDGPLPLARGVRWMDNELVNAACTLGGAAVAAGLAALL